MILKITILIVSLTYCISQLSEDDLHGNIWGDDNDATSTTMKPLADKDIFGIWDEDDDTPDVDEPVIFPNSTTSSENECECVPYYLCDQKATKAKMDNLLGDGLLDIRIEKKPVQCPHYLLKCCDDEDLSNYDPEPDPEPTTTTTEPPKPKGCGYRNLDSTKTPTDDSTSFGEFPWVVVVYYTNSTGHFNYACGGTLIHPEVVLTAAHCLTDLDKQPKIRAGEWDSRNTNEKYPHQDRDVASVALHAQYSGTSQLYNDIALLFLKKPVDLAPHINVVCLPPPDTVVNNLRCVSSGWGKETFGKGSVLSRLELPMVPRRQCQDDLRRTRLGYRFNLHQSFVCAGGEAGKDTCKGDGGSPLVCPIAGESGRYHLVGMVSWGIGCGGHRVPGVYVNVPHFRKWIDEKLKRKMIDTKVYQAKYN